MIVYTLLFVIIKNIRKLKKLEKSTEKKSKALCKLNYHTNIMEYIYLFLHKHVYNNLTLHKTLTISQLVINFFYTF